jgi:phage protein D
LVLRIGEVTLSDRQLQHLTEVSYEESLVDMAELTFSLQASESAPLTELIIKVGTEVELSLGWGTDLQHVFVGDVTKLSPEFSLDDPAQLNVVCHDRSYKLRRIPPPQVYKESNHKSIATQVVKRHKMTLAVHPPDKLAGFQLEDDQAVVQIDETDWQTLDGIAKMGAYNLLVHGDTVLMVDDVKLSSPQIHEYLRPGSEPLAYTFIYRPTPDDLTEPNTKALRSFTPELGVDGQRSTVEVKSWASAGAKGETYGKGKLKDIPTKGIAYTEIVVKTETVEVLRITGEAVRTTAQAKYLARSEMEKRAARLVKGEVELSIGNANLRVGMKVHLVVRDLEPFGSIFTGDYIIEAVSHELDSEGAFLTAFDVRRSTEAYGVTVA